MKPSTILLAAILAGWFTPFQGLQAQGTTNSPSTVPAGKPPRAALVSQDLAASRSLFESWRPPVPPARLIGNIHYVGLKGVCSFLITTPDGHILIDSCFEDSVPEICRNVEQLGFKVRDIKFLLSSHAHADHTAGHASMKKATGAKIVASAADAHLLETGGADDFSPFPKELMAYTPVKADRIVKDGERVTLGGATLTAHLTPGHTKGATSWAMEVMEGGMTQHVVFSSSLSIVEPTRLVDNPKYPGIAEDFADTFKKLKTLPCDVFFGPHGDQFSLVTKLERLQKGANPNPFIDSDGWRRLIANAERSYLRQLDAEKSAR